MWLYNLRCASSKKSSGRIVKAIPGARGGGKPDLAEGGVDGDKLDEALQAVPQIVRQLLGA